MRKARLGALLVISQLLLCAGCATRPSVRLPESTRVLGAATTYLSTTGDKLEVIHDPGADAAIVKLPQGGLAVLPAEIVGSEEHYGDNRMTLWEHDGGATLWVDGKLVFSGTAER